MKKFTVEVHYGATLWVEIEAEDAVKAEAAALAKAYQDAPLDELYAEVVYSEEVKS
jgi:hypothetical protein